MKHFQTNLDYLKNSYIGILEIKGFQSKDFGLELLAFIPVKAFGPLIIRLF